MTDQTPMRIGDQLVTTKTSSEVLSPFSGAVVGRVPVGTEEHIDRAIDAALACHRDGPPPAFERARVLDRAADLLDERQEAFAQSISAESAKPIKTARVEAARAVETFRFAAAVARTMAGEMVALDASSVGVGKIGFVQRMPIGVIAAISPFNFPLNLVAHKLAPAIAAGCPVVLKPASSTPLTALKLANMLLDECGLPAGWLNVVTCNGATADRMVTHDDIAMVTFTGSPAVGWAIRAAAPRKKVSLELGNNAPVVIEPDGDWSGAARKIAIAGFSFAGQSCISVQRVYVHASIHDEFVAALVAAVERLVTGDPTDDGTDVSALITPADTTRVLEWVQDAVAEGASVATGGNVVGGVLVPTVLIGVAPEMEVCRNEVFGPVVGVAAYVDFSEALRIANDSRYGLQASVFTSNIAKALEATRTLEFGAVMVNEVPTWRADQMPYGGLRDSGNTREGPKYSAIEMTEERLIVIQP
ncbi:MAG: aldehyde dehydrogenase family protein [Actinomycetes bacterium]